MDYIESLDNAVVGHAYTSVFGAGTSASEFEFLTGNSMAFLPSGSIPYQQYILERVRLACDAVEGIRLRSARLPSGRNSTSWQRNHGLSAALALTAFKCGDDMDVSRRPTEHRLRQRPLGLSGRSSGSSSTSRRARRFSCSTSPSRTTAAYTVEDYPAEVQLADDAPGAYPNGGAVPDPCQQD